MAKKPNPTKTTDHKPGKPIPGLSSKSPLPVAKKGESPYPTDKAPPPLWSNFGKALRDVPGIAAEVRELQAKRATIQEEIDAHNANLREIMGKVDSSKSWSVRDLDADWVVCYTKPNPGKKLVPALLLQAGVTDKQLAKGYKEVPKKPFVSVKGRNEKFEQQEEEE